MDLRDKLTNRMDQLQAWMESNYHLEHADTVTDHIGTITFAWSILSEEDRDYIQASQFAIQENLEWK